MTTSHPPLFPLKRLAAIRSSNVDKVVENGEIPIRLCNYVDVYNNDQIHPALEFTDGSVKQNEIDRFGLRSGDVLITKDSETPDDIAVPALVVRSAGDLVCGYHLALLRPNPSRLSGTFLFYAIKSQLARSAFSVLAQGITRFGLTLNGIGSVKVPLPDLPTQKAIAEFLDRETSRIDQLIEKKQRMVEVLGEKRQAVISHAVTKGLDPDVPMKDSGVEWIGKIPTHWEVRRLKHLLTEPLKYGANEPADHIDPDLPRYIRITDIQESGTLREDSFRSLPEEISKPYLLTEGDILFARSGATVGKIFRYDPSWGRAAYAGYLIRARLDVRTADSKFVEYVTRSQGYSGWLLCNLIQTTIQNVSAERYASFRMPVPIVAEQRAIAVYLNEETANIDDLVAKIRETIDRLREFRPALITAAVTGQIDVSTWGKQGTTARRLDEIEGATGA